MRAWPGLVCGAITVVVCACCPPMPAPANAGSAGSGATAGSATASCDGVRAHVVELYRNELTGSANPGAVDDNTAMVMKDCAKDPARVAACAAGAKSVTELEHGCLIPLDPEGTEGDALKK
jgi:hypothetical protein